MVRRLSAIVAVDVVGYSRLMGADEAGTLARLKDLRREVVQPAARTHRGRIIKLMGDGALMEFASAVDAVTFAVAVQEQVEARAAAQCEDRPIRLRIGINVGDVMVEGDDLYGDGVNVAARLEGLAEPGGICISGTAYDQVSKKVAVAFEDMGEQTVKNIAEPLRAYAVRLGDADAGATTNAGGPPAAPADRPSIAVLAFDNLSDDPDQAFFADGLVEDIITELSRDPDLFVIARNSSFAYKGKATDVRTIARELGVRYVLEGSVRAAAGRIRLTAQLIDAETNRHLWAERYDRAMEDVFQVQDELTATIFNSLLAKLTQENIQAAQRRAPSDIDAYTHYQRSFGSMQRFNKEDNERARCEAEAAVRIDSDYARAHMALAWAWLYAYWSGWAEDKQEALDAGYQAARKAVAADRGDYWGHAALGFAELCLGHYDRALDSVDQSVALNPNGADALAMRGAVLNLLGRPEEGLAELRRAVWHNPHHPDWYLQALGRALFFLRRYDEAIPYLERMARANPDLPIARTALAAAYEAAGRRDDARVEVTGALEISPTLTVSEMKNTVPISDPELLDLYMDCLRRAGLPE